MADPVIITTTVITLATVIKDLIDVGHNIKRSIEKVRENRRRIRDFTEEILRMLSNLKEICGGHEALFQTPELLFALGELKADMMFVLSVVTKISTPEPRRGLRAFQSHFKVWLKREDIESEIKRLKEHVNRCCTQFMTLSVTRIEQASARIENTSVRVEQRLIINNVEHQVKLERLQSMMTRMLAQSQFGHGVVSRTMEIVTSDPNHRSIESQFLSLQTMRFIDAFEKYTTTHYFRFQTASWDPVKEPLRISFLRPKSNLHVLQTILATMLQIKDHPTAISMKDIAEMLVNLGGELSWLNMESEATASDGLAVQVFRHLALGENSAGCLPRLGFTLWRLSNQYQYQLRHELAVQASEQSVYWCHVASEREPDVDNRALLLASLNTHSTGLRTAGQTGAAISAAQDALVVCRTLLPEIFQLASTGSDWDLQYPEYGFQASQCTRSFFCLGGALSDASRHCEAYLALKEGLEIVAHFSGSIPPPSGSAIDALFNNMCSMAEAGEFEPDFLAEVVTLYGNLSRIYPQEFSKEFLLVLYTRTYFSNYGAATIRDLRLFLEPSSDSPPPIMDDFSTSTPWFDDGIVESAIHAYYAAEPNLELDSVQCFIAYLIQTHPEIAIPVMRAKVSSLILDTPIIDEFDWLVAREFESTVLYTSQLSMQLSRPEGQVGLELLTDLTAHSRENIDLSLSSPMKPSAFEALLLLAVWRSASSSDALAIAEGAVQSTTTFQDGNESDFTRSILLALVLADVGRFAEAETVLHDAAKRQNNLDPPLCLVATESLILRQTGRKDQALLLLVRRTSNVPKRALDIRRPDDILLYYLFTDLSSAQLEAGQTESALIAAEKAVAKCRELHLSHPHQLRPRLAVAHALTALSNCLAACGRADEGLRAAQEAALIYAGPPWHGFCPDGYRPQEFSSKAFHTLSLRLATSGNLDEALVNAEKAVDEYRELVSLAIRHTPSLAGGLRNLASRFWDVDRRNESLTALKEAISLLREVADQQPHHFLSLANALEQLSEYLSVQGEVARSSTAAFECADIRERLARSPVSAEEEEEGDNDPQIWDAEEGSGSSCEGIISHGAALAIAAQTEGDHELPQSGISPFQADGVPLSPPEARVAYASFSVPSEPSTSATTQQRVAGGQQPEEVVPKATKDISMDFDGKRDGKRVEVNLIKIELKNRPVDIIWWILLGILGLFCAWSVEN
ncbi:hypothetical protein C8J57DRAFT_687782 [Mycena rebaudengoi]|nr:hypothetical protein C8J57DRAFT_687782 [Mycena rebaudengoi]